MILVFVHSESLTSETFPCFPWPPWNNVCLFLHSQWQQQYGLHCKTAVCNFPKSTWEIEVIIWMNLEWWGLHALRHVYFHCFPCLPLWPVMLGSKWDWTDPGTVGSKGSCKWCLRSACQSWSWAWNKRCWLWELHLVYKVAWWRTGLESGALGGVLSVVGSARHIHLLATPVTAKQTERTNPPYSQEPPRSKRSPKQQHW